MKIPSSKVSAGTLFICVLAVAASAQADAGVPMLMLMWPGLVFSVWPVALIVFFSIVFIEAEIGRRMLDVGYPRWLLVSGTANLASTAAGIPVTYGLSIGMMEFIDLFYRSAPETFKTLPHWIIPLAVLILCTPFFYFISVGVEYFVASQIVSNEQRTCMKTWSWRANTVSYGALTLLLLFLLFV